MNEAPSEGRNLVVCFDGTNYEFDREPTNVVRLIQVLGRNHSKRQLLYYDPGVGTLPEPGILIPMLKTLTRWFGLAFGLGLSHKVAQAYTYLIDFWEPNDRVFLFGFSRGAYTARVLAGLLHQLGLLPRGNYNLIPYAMKYFRRITEGRHHQSRAVDTSKWKKLCDDFRHTFARAVKPGDNERRFQVHFLGVWDTVSSVGWVWDPKHFPFTAYNPSVKHIRHAVAIDERRAFFRQNLFRPAPGQDVLELWFPGGAFRHWWGWSTRRRSTLVEFVPMDARTSSHCWLIFRCGKIERACCRKAFASLGRTDKQFVSICILVSRGNLAETYVLPEIKDSLPTLRFWTAPRHTFRGSD